MFCTKCGNRLSDEAIFCPKCGAKISALEAAPLANDNRTFRKTNKELIYESLCKYIRRCPGVYDDNPRFGELENYEVGADGMIYCELVAVSRNTLGQTKKTRFGAVIQKVESDGNVVFKGPGPQLIPSIGGSATAKLFKATCGFRKA